MSLLVAVGWFFSHAWVHYHNLRHYSCFNESGFRAVVGILVQDTPRGWLYRYQLEDSSHDGEILASGRTQAAAGEFHQDLVRTEHRRSETGYPPPLPARPHVGDTLRLYVLYADPDAHVPFAISAPLLDSTRRDMVNTLAAGLTGLVLLPVLVWLARPPKAG